MTYPNGYPGIVQAYGNPVDYVNDHRAWEDAILVTKPLAHPLPYAYAPATVTKITAHRLVVDVFVEFYAKAVETGCELQRLAFGGAYCWRAIRGGTTLSTHTWGIAIDTDPIRNPLGVPWNPAIGLPPAVVDIARGLALTWGGDWSRPDCMHMQAASGY